MLSEIDAIAMTYFHTCTIKRKIYVTDEFGAEEPEIIIIADNVKCAVSKNSLPNLVEGGLQTYSTTHKLYTYPEIDIKAGDFIIANVEGDLMKFQASRPFKYPTHLEVPILYKEVI